MIRRISAILVGITALVGFNVSSASAASTGYIDTYCLFGNSCEGMVNSGHGYIVRVAAYPQFNYDPNASVFNNVWAIRGRCGIRILNSDVVSGVRIDDCAIGYYGGAVIETCAANACPALSGSNPFANATSDGRVDTFAGPGGDGFRVRITYSYRTQPDGILHTANFLGGGTEELFKDVVGGPAGPN